MCLPMVVIYPLPHEHLVHSFENIVHVTAGNSCTYKNRYQILFYFIIFIYNLYLQSVDTRMNYLPNGDFLISLFAKKYRNYM
jgi:hypothetical protein